MEMTREFISQLEAILALGDIVPNRMVINGITVLMSSSANPLGVKHIIQ